MKILIIKLGALGDVLRTTFVARGLKQKYGKNNCTIFWLTKEGAAGMLKQNEFIDYIIGWKEREQLLKEHFDWVLSLDDEEEPCTFVTRLSTKRLQGAYMDKENTRKYTKDVAGWFGMGILRPEKLGGKERADELKKENRKTFQEIYMEMFELPKNVDTKPILNLTVEELMYGQNFLKQHNITEKNKVIGVNTGAADRWLLKIFTIEKTAELCNTLKERYKESKILILGGPDEIERNKEIKALCPNQDIINVEPVADICLFASILNICNLIVTSDSLALHLSLAQNKQTIVFFGPTSPWEIEMFGLGEKVYKESNCLCCYKKTTDKRPSCIDLVTPKDIFEAGERMLR
jgi:heptosyltransferase-2